MKKPLFWICLLFVLAPLALSFLPGWPAHGYGHVWFLVLPYLYWRRPQQRKRLLLYGLGLLVQTLAYPDPDLGFLGWFLLLPYLVAREQEDGASWWRSAFLYGFFRAHAGFYWLGSIHFAAWFGISVGSAIVFVLVFEGVLRWLKPIPFALRVGIGWVLFEWTHSWFVGGFPWLYLSHTQYEALPVIQVADIIGAYGVSFLMAFIQAASLEAWRLRRFTIALPVAGVLLASMLVYGFVRGEEPEGEGSPVLLVQSALPHSVKKYEGDSREEVRSILVELTEQGLAEHPETKLIIWPETMYPYALVEDNPGRFRWDVRRLANRFKRPAVYGINAYRDLEGAKAGESYNAVIMVGSDGKMGPLYRKQRLVPIGEEFLPRRFLSKQAADALLSWLVDNLGFPRSCDLRSGEGFVVLDGGPGLRGVPLICFEGLYAGLTREAAGVKGADFLLHLVNNGWFGRGFEQRQCVAAWVFRAVETRTPFVSCANAGVSCGIAPDGSFFSRLDEVFEKGTAFGLMPPRWSPPLFLRGGQWAFAVGLGALALGFLLRGWLSRDRLDR